MPDKVHIIVFVNANVFAKSQIKETMVNLDVDSSAIIKTKVKYRSGNHVVSF